MFQTIDSTSPSWMLSKPQPELERRLFNGRELIGWRGYAPAIELHGWVDNPRLEIPVDNFRQERFRDPNDEELLDIMLEVSVRDKADDDDEDESEYETAKRKNSLLQLTNNISLNGVRMPLVVTFDRRILDGNRRYFANMYLLQKLEREKRKNFEALPVWVMLKSASQEDEELILTELNSIDDCKVKWPYYVLAQRVYRDHVDGNMSIDELKQKYHDWSTSRIRTVIEASRVAQEFIEYHEDEIDAKDIAFRKLIWFDQLRRSNSTAMKSEDFRTSIYDLIMQRNSPFSKTTDFKDLQEIYNNPEAWEHLTTHEGKEALRGARFVIERDRYEGGTDAQARMERINALLRAVTTDQQFSLIEQAELQQFHSFADQVPDPRRSAEANAERLIHALDDLTSKAIAQLPEEVLERLQQTLRRIEQQAESYRE